jgi:hypothetical protein
MPLHPADQVMGRVLQLLSWELHKHDSDAPQVLEDALVDGLMHSDRKMTA